MARRARTAVPLSCRCSSSMAGWAHLRGVGRQPLAVLFVQCVVLLCVAMQAAPAVAAGEAAGPPRAAPVGIPWAIARFQYSTSGASVTDVLADLSAATHVPIAAGAAGEARAAHAPVDSRSAGAADTDIASRSKGNALSGR